jgi:hypothetical protein
VFLGVIASPAPRFGRLVRPDEPFDIFHPDILTEPGHALTPYNGTSQSFAVSWLCPNLNAPQNPRFVMKVLSFIDTLSHHFGWRSRVLLRRPL